MTAAARTVTPFRAWCRGELRVDMILQDGSQVNPKYIKKADQALKLRHPCTVPDLREHTNVEI